MALSNRDRVGRMLEIIAPALDDYISSVIAAEMSPSAGANWVQIVANKDVRAGANYDPLDPQIQFRMLTESAITTSVRPRWYPFSESLGRVGEAYATELRDARNNWAHNGTFFNDDAYRVFDTAERLMQLVAKPSEADRIKEVRLNLRRVTADKDDKRVLKAAVSNPEAVGLRPWREVLAPPRRRGHRQLPRFRVRRRPLQGGDGRGGRFRLFRPDRVLRPDVSHRRASRPDGRAHRRLNGDDNASPVINLQTNFGGGKTHSMLALWHVAVGMPLGEYPQETQELLAANKYLGVKVNRAAIVGNHFSPTGVTKPDGTRVNTMWGELAWQLGGAEAYKYVAQADSDRTHPGTALHELLAAYSPAVILIDEWVAYARSLVGRDDLAGGPSMTSSRSPRR